MLNLDDFVASGEWFDGRYKLLRPLSKDGGTADVWLAIDMNTVEKEGLEDGEETDSPQEDEGLKVAIKVYRPQNALDIEGERRFRDEYTIVYNCHHTNLLQPYNFSIFGETPYLVMPYCQKGSSEQLIGKMTDENELWRYIHDVAAGLAYLHDCTPPIIHQDVKPANVLIHDSGSYALTDFGISSKSGKQNDSFYGEEVSGTMAYMAPERFSDGSTHRKESDIWAFGATLYELLVGTPPFGENGGNAQTDDELPKELDKLPVANDIKKLISACLSADFAARPTARQLEEAASMQMFPARQKGMGLWGKIALVLCGAMLAIGILFGWLKYHNPVVEEIPVEQAYAQALRLMDSDNPDSVKLGVERMDTVAKKYHYLPASYELAHTFGFYSDHISIKRKEILGIESGYYSSVEIPEDIKKYAPKNDKYNEMAIRYFTDVVNSDSTDYNSQKINSAYRLGLYYQFVFKNPNLALKYFKMVNDLPAPPNDDSLESIKTNAAKWVNYINSTLYIK